MAHEQDGWTVRQRRDWRRAERDVSNVVVEACPKCGAVGDQPCRTTKGKVAKKNHKERA